MQPVISLLSPLLANQIAAGEVVDRPSSVVKELLENSLDAGASTIIIDLEKGGTNLIKIRDDGVGISKEDLSLALARHATSKIKSLDDLENITSFGFRGEALASISSVSRLTLTSRTALQDEAWQAFAQGSNMDVTLKPASHPIGTTVQVANLFFNTPARRKFLRSDKTEYAHIFEVIRKIALASPHISFILNHNGKQIKNYKANQGEWLVQQQERILAICGENFINNATFIDWSHSGMHLKAWIGDPRIARVQNDLSFCYINNRIMRDRTINHALKQAFANEIKPGLYPCFVLFLELPPLQIDVNVHPAKNEVKFHHSRLVHDFIVQAVHKALNFDANNRSSAGLNAFVSDKSLNLLENEFQEDEELELINDNLDFESEVNLGLAVVQNKALLFEENQEFYLISLVKLMQIILMNQHKQGGCTKLLIPKTLEITKSELANFYNIQSQLEKFGFEIDVKFFKNKPRLCIFAQPSYLASFEPLEFLLNIMHSNQGNLLEFFDTLNTENLVFDLKRANNLLLEATLIDEALVTTLKQRVDFNL